MRECFKESPTRSVVFPVAKDCCLKCGIFFYAGSFEVFWHWRGELGRCSQRTLDGATESGGRKVDELYQQRVAWGSCAIPRYRYWYRQAVRRRSRNLVQKCWCWSIGCLHSPPIVEPIKKPTMNIKKSEFSSQLQTLELLSGCTTLNYSYSLY